MPQAERQRRVAYRVSALLRRNLLLGDGALTLIVDDSTGASRGVRFVDIFG